MNYLQKLNDDTYTILGEYLSNEDLYKLEESIILKI